MLVVSESRCLPENKPRAKEPDSLLRSGKSFGRSRTTLVNFNKSCSSSVSNKIAKEAKERGKKIKYRTRLVG
jgi:hypothetical protein